MTDTQMYDPANTQSHPILKKAVKRIAGMDKRDGGVVGYLDMGLALRTVLSAISAGISSKDWSCVADAYVMIQQLEAVGRNKWLAPTHTTTFTEPHSHKTQKLVELPGRLDLEYLCKYCHQTHSNWWNLSGDAILCGECNYASQYSEE